MNANCVASWLSLNIIDSVCVRKARKSSFKEVEIWEKVIILERVVGVTPVFKYFDN